VEFPLDLRQSDAWGEYLKFLGWNIFSTSAGVNFATMQSKFGNVVKVQRPAKLLEEDLKEIEKKALEINSALIKVEPSLKQDLDVLRNHGYIKNKSPLCPSATLFIDLTKSEDTLEKSLSRSCKYSIRRARREGVEIEFHRKPSGEILESFYKIHKSTGRQKKFYIQSFDDVSKKVEVFGDNAILGVAFSDGTITGANLFLGFGEAAWYIHGGTTPEGRKNKNGYELCWKSILYLKGLGFKWLDLEGVDDKRFPNFTRNWGGLSHFKEKFGGIRVEFPSPYVKLINPWLKRLSKFIDLPI